MFEKSERDPLYEIKDLKDFEEFEKKEAARLTKKFLNNRDIREDIKNMREVKDVFAQIDKYGNECDLPSKYEIIERIVHAAKSYIEEKYSEEFVDAHVFRIDLNGNELDRLPPEVIYSIAESKEYFKEYYDSTEYYYDFADLRNNNISDMCELKNIETRQILIENNPIEKIKFKDPAQFLNAVYLNDFGSTKLPEDIKTDLKKCRSEIFDAIVSFSIKNLDFDKPPLPDDTAKLINNAGAIDTYFTNAETCKNVYDKIQNSDMCRR